MEKELIINPNYNLDDVLKILLRFKERNESVYCIFNGHILHSDNIDIDNAYLAVTGFTKENYLRKMKELFQDSYKKINEPRKKVEIGEKQEITMDKVVAGLKFLSENQNLSHEEIQVGLSYLGCTFTQGDISRQFDVDMTIFRGMEIGNIACGASLIAIARRSDFCWQYIIDTFLANDTDHSIYHFIRLVTNDSTYTKENVVLDKTKRYM